MKTQLQHIIKTNLVYPDATNLQQRGIADKLEDQCNQIITAHCQDVKPARSRRSIEDISVGGIYVDHKTSDRALDFKMPNLISIDRLMKLDRDLYYNFVVYDSVTAEIVDVSVLSVYELNWQYLKIQNLGAGQLQISNMQQFLADPRTDLDRDQWLAKLSIEAVDFYQRLLAKTRKRQQKWQQWKPGVNHDS
jgi:hypothetical protein